MQATTVSTPTLPVKHSARTFYSLAAAQTVSQIGSNMSFLAVGIYVYQQTGQATPLTLLLLFMLLPMIIAGGVAGVLADRYDRRILMIIGDTGAALGTLALVISVSSGNFQLWHVYAAAFWQSIFSSIQRPAFEASVSQLVPDAQRQRANAVMQMSKPASILVSSAMTGLLYVAVGVIGIFLLDLISFLVAVTTTLLVRIPAPPRTEKSQERQSMLKDWNAGITFLWSRRPLFIMLAHASVFSFLITSVYALTTPYLLARTGSALTLGMITAIMSIGGLVGAIGIGAWGGFKRRIDTIMLGIILVLVATVLFGTNQPSIVMGAALFVAMMGVAATNTTLMTLLQSKVPGDMQGRVFALFMQLTLVLTPFGYLSIGPLADKVLTPLASSSGWAAGTSGMLFGTGAAGGMGVLFAATAGLGLLATLIAYTLPAVRHMETTLPSYQSAAEASPITQTEM